MLYFVPFTGAGRQVTDRDGNAERIGQFLQFYFLQTHTIAVAASAISGDQ